MKRHPSKYWPMLPYALLSLEGVQLGMRLGLSLAGDETRDETGDETGDETRIDW